MVCCLHQAYTEKSKKILKSSAEREKFSPWKKKTKFSSMVVRKGKRGSFLCRIIYIPMIWLTDGVNVTKTNKHNKLKKIN